MGARGHPVHLSRVGGSEFIVGIGTRRDTTDGRDLLLLSPPAATGGNCQSDSHESESHLRPVVRSLLCHCHCHCVMTLPGHVHPPSIPLPVIGRQKPGECQIAGANISLADTGGERRIQTYNLVLQVLSGARSLIRTLSLFIWSSILTTPQGL